MLFLAEGARGPEQNRGITGGDSRAGQSGQPNIISRELTGPKKQFHRRGEGGEGRARMQSRSREFCDSFVHVFSEYVASLSNKLNFN